MDAFDDGKAELYFGNDEEQERLIQTLSTAAMSGKGALHLVCGGTVCGKSSAIEQVRMNLEKNPRFACAVSPDDFDEGNKVKRLPSKLAKLLETMHDDEKGLEVQHYVFRDKERDAYVVIADGETPPGDKDARALLARAANAIADLEAKGVAVTWIADAPILQQAASVFKPSASAQKALKEHQNGLKLLQQNGSDSVVAHTLHYDVSNIQECMWEHIRSEGQAFTDMLRSTSHWDKTMEWENAVKAALADDRAAYDEAFAILAKRAQAQKSRAA